MDVVKELDYIGQQNMVIIPYMRNWNGHTSNLSMLKYELANIVDRQPPVPRSQLPQ